MDKGGEYSLKWNSHKTTVMSAFTCLYENEKHADCILAAEGKSVKAHKVMIAACSPYLERLIEEHSKDKSSNPILIFNDLSFFELKALCEYMYKGEVNVPKEHLDSFLKVAKNLQVRGLCDGGGGDSIGGENKSVMKSPDKRKVTVQQPAAKRKRNDGFESDTSADNVSFISSPSRGQQRSKQIKTTAKVVACPPRAVQEVKPVVIKQEEPETVYEETVYQDLTFDGEIYQDPNSEAGTSNNENTMEFGTWNDGNSNDESGNQDQELEIEMAIVCSICGRQYRRLSTLKRHLKYECGINAALSCPHCKYRTKHNSSLKRHMAQVHNEEEVFSCGKCSRRYRSEYAVKRHQKFECGITAQFKCPLCDYKAKQPGSLKKHVGITHGIEFLDTINTKELSEIKEDPDQEKTYEEIEIIQEDH